jgi:hypothetical protein
MIQSSKYSEKYLGLKQKKQVIKFKRFILNASGLGGTFNLLCAFFSCTGLVRVQQEYLDGSRKIKAKLKGRLHPYHLEECIMMATKAEPY